MMKEWKPLRYDGGGDVHVGDLCKRMSDGGLVYLVIGEVLPTPPEDGYLLLPVIYSGRHDVGTVFDRDRRSLFIVVGGSPTFAWSFADMARCLHAIMTIIFDGDDAETIKKRYGDDDA